MFKPFVLITAILVICGLSLLGSTIKISLGAESNITSEARLTITPIPREPVTTGGGDVTEDTSIRNAQIILIGDAYTTTNSQLTIVQWQDSNGAWHDVDGWKGHFDDQQSVRWWVEPKDFNTGPFRWVIQEPSSNPGEMIWISAVFHLPDSVQILRVHVNSLH